ncbi:response regulator transcription factor [Actibacterium pelagium]|uniref:Response regulator n=1 Tax=Actibacterium pelagium TaxID=2029103 RepID=A0A917ALF1_9RHOB|nr:response regulator [Actibacterium pelagium]GGE60528.1 response regulator [Actibacterium pelagium]
MSETSILIVEDEDNIALALTHVLRREGYAVDRVADGAKAVPAIRAMLPDLVLLDVMLPEVSGYEICQTVRMDEGLTDVKILIMTARGTDVERRKGLALGANGFITKPFELTDLKQQVADCLAGDAS